MGPRVFCVGSDPARSGSQVNFPRGLNFLTPRAGPSLGENFQAWHAAAKHFAAIRSRFHVPRRSAAAAFHSPNARSYTIRVLAMASQQ
eukprot:COSAG01_NODE_37901_length_497_cov_0.964824_1_plen_87_part_10